MQFKKVLKTRRLVSLTPLIDVVFILLIFFMLASNFSQWSTIDVSAPAPSKNVQEKMEGTILVRISEQGRIDVGGKPVNIASISAFVSKALKENPDQKVLVKPHENLPIQKMVDILDLLRDTGITNFSIIR